MGVDLEKLKHKLDESCKVTNHKVTNGYLKVIINLSGGLEKKLYQLGISISIIEGASRVKSCWKHKIK